ncbi:cadherin-like beta sandwich domain-containing protein [Haliangium sp.]|uniref:cadherin-like beta sandwich domain-containing protein n=1 Tax=Haliangium sp. TaxID=2663208 RepID=UPI003D0F0DCB
MLFTGCSSGGPDDGAPVVRGVAAGVVAPITLRLEHAGGSLLLTVDRDGPFAFPVELEPGDPYAVSFVDQPTCVLENAAGVFGSTDSTVGLACEGVFLKELVVSGPSAPALTLDPATSAYEAEVSLLQSSASITAVPTHPDATVSIAGARVDDGLASAPIALALGSNPVEIAVTGPGGGTRTYAVDLRRAAAVVEAGYGKASNTSDGDQFGFSVAMSGDTLAVGAPAEDSSATGIDGFQGDGATNSGAVYVFRREGSTWAQEAYVKASNTSDGDQFGIDVALSDDTLVVGANRPEGNGAAYVFQRSGTSWTQQAVLRASNADDGDNFGVEVAISGDTVAVSGYEEDSGDGDQADNSAPDSGAVYVFQRSGATWAQQAYLKAFNPGAGDKFGMSLALSDDTLAVGAYLEDSGATGVDGEQDNETAPDSGAVYVFRRSGSTWSKEAYLKASNTGTGDGFGVAMAMSGDTLAVGAEQESSAATGIDGDQNNDDAPDSGAVYVFERSGSTWTQQAYIKASNTGSSDHFGVSVDLVGEILAVGAELEDSAGVGVDADQASDSASDSGAAYVFRREGQRWVQQAYVKPFDTGVDDQFGTCIALSGEALVVGADREAGAGSGFDGDVLDNNAELAGAVFVYY